MEKDRNTNKDQLPVSDDHKKISLFDGDDYYLYVYKKAEKIATAVYMITDFFGDSEPLKTNMRTAALCLIDMSLSFNTTSVSDRKDLLSNVIRDSLSIVSYSEIATLAGIESSMNHRILKSELENFIKTIEDRENPQNLGRHFVLSEDVVKDELPVSPPRPSSVQSIYTSSVHPLQNKEKSVVTPLAARPQIVKKIEKSNRKSGRQESIISVIRAKGELSIKDLTGVIKGCSEKTIQRELLVLVEQGVLNKVGERRWSRYSLAN